MSSSTARSRSAKARELEPQAAGPASFLTEIEAADHLRLQAKTLRNWRSNGLGPHFYRLAGRTIRYDLTELDNWARNNGEAS